MERKKKEVCIIKGNEKKCAQGKTIKGQEARKYK